MSVWKTRLALFSLCTACCLLGMHRASDASLSFDEAFSWKLVDGRSLTELVEKTASDVHPPLYYLLLYVWTGAFGTAPVGLRSLSILAAALCACAIYALGREASLSFGPDDERQGRARTAGVICAALAVANPSLAYYSQVARMYSLAALLSVVTGLLLLRALTQAASRWTTWLGYGVATAALLYTHNYGLFVFASETLVAAAYFGRRAARGEWTSVDSRTLLCGSLACAGVFAAYLPWLQTLAAQSAQVRSSYWISAVDLSTPFLAWYELLFAPHTKPGPFGGHVWPLQCLFCVVPAVVAALGLRQCRFPVVFLISIAAGTTAFAFIVSACMTPILVARYLLVALPFFLTATGCLLATVPDRALKTGVLAVAILQGVQAFHTAASTAVPISTSGSAQAARFIEGRRRADEQVLVVGPELFLRYQYYAADRGAARLLADPREVNHYGGAPVLDPQDFFRPATLGQSDQGRVWVVSWAANQHASKGLSCLLDSWRRESRIEAFLDRQPGHNVYVACYLRAPAHERVHP